MISAQYLCSCRQLLWAKKLTAQINTDKGALFANNSGKLKNPPKLKKNLPLHLNKRVFYYNTLKTRSIYINPLQSQNLVNDV